MHRPRLEATFQPQAWLNDDAVDVDGFARFDAADAFVALPDGAFVAVVREVLHDRGTDLDALAEQAGLVGSGKGMHDGPYYVRLAGDEPAMRRFLDSLGWDGEDLGAASVAAMKAAYAAMPAAPEDPADRIVGYQVGDAEGSSIQGDDDDPFGLASFDVLVGRAAAAGRAWVAENPGFTLVAIKADDVEEPNFVGRVQRVEPSPRP